MSIRPLFSVFFYAIVCNVPLWLASRWLGLSIRGLFGIEFLVLGAAALFFDWRWISWLVGPAIVIDFLQCFEETYMFSASELLRCLSSVPFYVNQHPAAVLAIVTVVIGTTMLGLRLNEGEDPDSRNVAGAVLLAGLVLMVVIDAGRGQMIALRADGTAPGRLSRNFVHRMMMEGVAKPLLEVSVDASSEYAPLPGASARMTLPQLRQVKDGGQSQDPNIVLVLVESWGKSSDKSLNERLAKPYLTEDLRRFYTVSQGSVPFRGPTVSGEMRELCGTTMAFSVISAPASSLSECLPSRLRQRGYSMMALHGFDADIFDRRNWYLKAGFQETKFFQDFQREGLERCPGPFPGTCDGAVAEWIGHRLKAQLSLDQPQFIYWMTLNSHLPVPLKNSVNNPPACNGASILQDDVICSWYQIVYNVHRSMAELAQQQINGRPTIFVIVGDHAPPFASEERRGRFSRTEVPYVLLQPRAKMMAKPEALQDLRVATVRPSSKSPQPLPLETELDHAHGHGD